MLKAIGQSIFLAIGVAACVVPSASAGAKELLYLTDNVPGGLDVDGPTSSSTASQMGMSNLLEPLIYFKQVGEENGVKRFDFAQFEGRLAESWDYDEKSLTWTLHLRHGVKSCDGTVFTADDVVYTFARALSVSGAGAVAWLPLKIASV
jgi:peptide/nickel transport system substrate-binding protein